MREGFSEPPHDLDAVRCPDEFFTRDLDAVRCPDEFFTRDLDAVRCPDEFFTRDLYAVRCPDEFFTRDLDAVRWIGWSATLVRAVLVDGTSGRRSGRAGGLGLKRMRDLCLVRGGKRGDRRELNTLVALGRSQPPDLRESPAPSTFKSPGLDWRVSPTVREVRGMDTDRERSERLRHPPIGIQISLRRSIGSVDGGS